MNNAPLMNFTSHINGKNAKVALYGDRVEWTRGGLSAGKMTAAALTLGASALATGLSNKDTNTILLRQITGVTTKKGLLNTQVSVAAGASSVAFNCSHSEAAEFKQRLLGLLA